MKKLYFGLFFWCLALNSFAASTDIYRSVGPGNTAVVASSSDDVVYTISGDTLSFDQAINGIVGVGDVFQYSTTGGVDDSLAFITARISQSEYRVQNASGGNPNAASDNDWKIFRAYTSLANAESGTENIGIQASLRDFDTGNRNIDTNNETWHFACYDDGIADGASTWNGWTTSSSDYIRVFTPYLASDVSVSQRHNGIWSTSAFRIVTTNTTSITNNLNYIRFEGLQIDVDGVISNDCRGIYSRDQTGTSHLYVSDCIIKGTATTGNSQHIGIMVGNSGDGYLYIWNNIIYDFRGNNANRGIYPDDSNYTAYLYNNTIQNCERGIECDNGITVAKNNLVQDCVDSCYRDTFSTASTYNISDRADSPGSNGVQGVVVFVNEGSDNFLLSSQDTVAYRAGTDLSADASLSFTDDINGNPRQGIWDAGAFQVPPTKPIYRSVAPGQTSSLGLGSLGNTVEISGMSATFSNTQSNQIGVGDVIQYDADNNDTVDALAFIIYRHSATNYTVTNATGGTPTATITADTNWAVFRAYTSLANAENGIENAGIDDGQENFDTWSGGRDIPANDEVWNIACYNNGADNSAVTIDGWTTDANHYIQIFTPYLSSQVGITHRHNGTWDTNAYRMNISNATAVYINEDNVRIEGLQIRVSSVNAGVQKCIYIENSTGVADYRMSYNVLRGITSAGFDWHQGLALYNCNSGVLRAWNNVIYNFNGNNTASGMEFNDPDFAFYTFNNTIQNCYNGLWRQDGSVIPINVITQDCTDGFAGTFVTPWSNYNVSDLAGDAPGTNSINNATVLFINKSGDDFHLSGMDTVAKENGLNVSGDPNLAFSDDIDHETRTVSWSIGADECDIPAFTMTPTPTFTVTSTSTHSPTSTPTPTASPTITPTTTPTVTLTATQSATYTVSATITLTSTVTPTLTVTPPFTHTVTPTITQTSTVSPTLTVTPSSTTSPSSTVSPTLTISATVTPTLTITITSTQTPRIVVPTSLENALVYPNPYRSDVKSSEEIAFHNLPQVATIKIYTITGNIIRTINKDSNNPTEIWNLRNEKGSKISSGVYIYIIQSGSDEKQGKFAILK